MVVDFIWWQKAKKSAQTHKWLIARLFARFPSPCHRVVGERLIWYKLFRWMIVFIHLFLCIYSFRVHFSPFHCESALAFWMNEMPIEFSVRYEHSNYCNGKTIVLLFACIFFCFRDFGNVNNSLKHYMAWQGILLVWCRVNQCGCEVFSSLAPCFRAPLFEITAIVTWISTLS